MTVRVLAYDGRRVRCWGGLSVPLAQRKAEQCLTQGAVRVQIQSRDRQGNRIVVWQRWRKPEASALA